MKVTVLALVVRDKRDNHIVDVYPVGDRYDHVTIEYSSKYVTPEEIRKDVESWMGEGHKMALDAEKALRENGVWFDSQEAKDFSDVGFLKIGVEEKEVEWD